MYYVGVDIGKRFHSACIIDESGKTVVKPFNFSVNASGFGRFLASLDKVSGDKESFTIACEATGAYWLTLFERVKSKEFPYVVVFNPLQVSSFRNKNIRGTKTDTLDCSLIANILRYEDYVNYQVPDNDLVNLRRLSRFRSDMVGRISPLKVKVLGVLDQVFPEYPELFSDVFGTTSKALLSSASTPEEIVRLDLRKLKTLLKKASWGHLGEKRALLLKKTASASVGTKLSLDSLSLQLKFMIENIQLLEDQLKAVEARIASLFHKQQTQLASIPGIAEVSGATILSEIGNIGNFKKDGAKKLVAFVGIDAKVRESGAFKGKRKMSKRGSRYLRAAIMQASFVASNKDPYFKSIYEKQIARGKVHLVALSHVANKLTHVIYSVLKNNKPYFRPDLA